MRVALVCGRYDPQHDGVADYVSRLAAVLEEAGMHVSVLSAAGGRLPAVRQLTQDLIRLRPDVAHVQFAPSAYGYSPAIGLLPVLLRGRMPVVTTLHEYGWWSWPPRLPPSAFALVERRGRWDRETLTLAPRSVGLIVTNDAHADVVRRRLGRTPRQVPIGPNVRDAGLSRSDARAQVARRFDVPVHAPLLVHFGFVHPVKGVRYAIEALPSMRARHGDVRLVVAGGFTSLALPEDEARAFRRELEQRAAAAGVSDAVTFTGHVPECDVSALLRGADAVVLPMTAGVTTKSGALIAAFDHGAPVAATVADSPDAELVDGRTVAAIGARRDADAVAHAVNRLLGDEALRAALATGGRAVAGRRTWQAAAEAHLAVYASAMRASMPRRLC